MTQETLRTLVDILETGVLHARSAAAKDDSQTARVLLDLVHNVPGIISGTHETGTWLAVDLASAVRDNPDDRGVRSIAAKAAALIALKIR